MVKSADEGVLWSFFKSGIICYFKLALHGGVFFYIGFFPCIFKAAFLVL